MTGDYTVAAVVKARGDDGLEAFLVGSDGAARGATLTRAYACVMVQQALHEELLRSCGSHGKWYTLPFVARDIHTHWRQD